MSVSIAEDDRALNFLFKRGILHFIFKAKQNEKIVSVRFSPKTHARVRFLFLFLFLFFLKMIIMNMNKIFRPYSSGFKSSLSLLYAGASIIFISL